MSDDNHPAVLAFKRPRPPGPKLTAEQQAKLQRSRMKPSTFTPEAEFFARIETGDAVRAGR